MPSFDALVVGGGHNGLVAAAVLARKGRRTLVLEAAPRVGGAAQTVAFAPGFRVSPVAHLLTHLDNPVVDELELHHHGLDYAADGLPTVALSAEARPLIVHGREADGDLAAEDRVAWRGLHDRLMRFAGVLKPYLAEIPPRLDARDRGSALGLAGLGLGIRRLGRDDMREFLRLMLMPAADVLEEALSDPRLMGLAAFDATLGTHLGPRSPNSMMTWYYRLAGGCSGRRGSVAIAKGGMGAVAGAIFQSAIAAGAEVRTSAPVERILIEGERAVGVRLADGEEIRARIVVSAANPRTTLMELVGPAHLETEHVRRLEAIRMRGNAAKLHLALDGLPEFRGLEPRALASRLVVAPSLRAVEDAFNPAKYGEVSAEPLMEIVLPSLFEPGYAPEGKHVLSAVVQFAPYKLRQGWERGRGPFLERCLATLERYAPGISGLVRHAELLSPADIESQYRMPGGHWHHGELAVDQMFMLRPFQAAAQYASPIDGLYLAGAGSHPGGNIMGLAGRNAARAILAREARR